MPNSALVRELLVPTGTDRHCLEPFMKDTEANDLAEASKPMSCLAQESLHSIAAYYVGDAEADFQARLKGRMDQQQNAMSPCMKSDGRPG